MTNSHTPGPWTFRDKQPDPDVAKQYGAPYFEIKGGQGFWPIKDTAFPFPTEGLGFSLSGIISESDARLIAAAPELLEVLRIVQPIIAQLPQAHDTLAKEFIRIVDAAIAKATQP